MADTIDRLQISVEAKAAQAQKQLNLLASSLQNVGQALKGIDGRQGGVDSTFASLQKLNKLDPSKMARSAVQLSNMSTAIQRMNSVSANASGVTKLVNSLSRLTKVDTGSFDSGKFAQMTGSLQMLASMPDVSSSVNRLVNAMSRLASSGSNMQVAAQYMPSLSKGVADAVRGLSQVGAVDASVTSLVGSISKLASAGDKTAVTASNLGALSTATLDFFQKMASAPEVSENTIRLAEALAKLAESGYKAGDSASGFGSIAGSVSTLKDKIRGALDGVRKFVSTIGNGIGKVKSFGSSVKSAFGSMIGFGPGIKSLTSNIKMLIGTLIGLRGIQDLVRGISSSLELGSRIQELENVVNTSFGGLKKGFTDLSDAVYEFAETTKERFGVSEVAARQYTGILMSMFNSSGFDQSDEMHKNAAQMSMDLTTLAGDIASFYDISADEAFQKIQSGMAGMVRPLRSIGINMSVANLEAYAMSQGITKSYQAMSQAEQMMLRFNYLLNATQYAQGDFAKTASSYANQVRLLKLSVQEFGTALGQGIIAAIRPALVALNTFMAYCIAAAKAFRTFMFTIFGMPETFGKGVVNDFADIADAGASLADSTGGGTGGGAAGNLADAAKSAKKLKKELTVLPFDELNQLAKDQDASGASSPGGSGGGGGGGVGGGGLGDFGLNDGIVDMDALLNGSKTAQAISKWGQMIRNAFEAQDWVGLGKAMTWGFNTGLKGLYEALDPAKIRGKVLPFIQAFTKTFNSFVQYFDTAMLGKTIGRAVNDAIWIANTFITNTNFQNIGRKVAILLNNMISEIDWTAIGQFFGNMFMILWNTAYGFVTTFDWRSLGTELGNAINGFINDVDWETIAQTIGGFVVGVLNGLSSFIETVDWKALGDSVGDFIKNLDWPGVLQGMFEAITAVLIGLGEFLAGLISDGFDAAVKAVTDPIDQCGGHIIAGLLAGMANAMEGIVTWIGDNIFTPILNGIKSAFGISSPAETMKEPGEYILEGLLQGITDKLTSLPEFFAGVKESFLNALSGAGTWLQEKGSALVDGIKTGWNNAKQGALSTIGGVGGEISKRVGNLSKTGKEIAEDFGSGFGGIKKSTTSTLSDAVKEIKSNVSIMQLEGVTSAKGFTDGFNRGLSSKSLSSTINAAFRSIFAVLNTNKNTLSRNGKEAGAAYTKGFSTGFSAKTMTTEASTAIATIVGVLKNSKGSFNDAGRELGNAFGNAFNAYSRLAVKTPKLTQNGTYYDAKTKTKIPTYQIEWHAEGGLFTRPTLVNGFGEAGDEAAIPLTNRRAMRRIANAIVDSSDNFGMNPMMLAEAVEYGVANALSGQNFNDSRPITVPVILNGIEIARAVRQGNQKLDRRYNPSAVMG